MQSKTKGKRVLASILSVLMIFGLVLPKQTFAMVNTKAKIEVGQVKGRPGESVRVPVTLGNIAGSKITGASIFIEYDKNKLTLTGVSAGDIVPTPADVETDLNEIIQTNGQVHLFYFDNNAATKNTHITTDGVLAYMTFNVAAEATGSCAIQIASNSELTNDVPQTIPYSSMDIVHGKVELNFSYTITYDKGTYGSISGLETEDVVPGDSPKAIPTITPDSGYVFKGWSKDGGATLLTDSMMLSEKINNNTTYKAYYTMKAPVLSLASAGDGYACIAWNEILGATGYNIYQNDSMVADAVYTVSNAVYSYNASGLTNGIPYTFEVKAIINSVSSERSNKITVTPQSTPVTTCTVSFNSQGGSALESIRGIIAGGTVAQPAVPIRREYIFGGWYKEAECIHAWNFSLDTVTTDTTLYAKWTAIPSDNGNSTSDSTSDSTNTSTSTSSTTTQEQPKNNGVDVIVNGERENAGIATTTKQGENTILTIAVDSEKLKQKLESEGNNAVITIPVSNSKADHIVGSVTGEMVKNMETKQAVLEIKTDKASYKLPAQQLDIEAISKTFGASVELKDIKVNVEIGNLSQTMATVVKDVANRDHFEIVVPPLEFTVTAVYGGKTVEVSNFDTYIERTIAIPDGVDPNKITTAVVTEPDGTVRHVPTKVSLIDGKYFAIINSRTNSTYSVVWNPIEFKDVQQHWAKQAVNDMGSRMVISGVGEGLFEPDRDITRAEFAAIIVRALGLKPGVGSNSFKDVNQTQWYSDFIKTAQQYKIISGYEDQTFRPMDKITREQAMTMIARAMSITDLNQELTKTDTEKILSAFSDGKLTSDYAQNGIANVIKAGIVSGRNDNTIAPNANITRAEVAVLVRNLLQKSGLI
jgi:uncharacterized repeat protein (TIGR02543 family)